MNYLASGEATQRSSWSSIHRSPPLTPISQGCRADGGGPGSRQSTGGPHHPQSQCLSAARVDIVPPGALALSSAESRGEVSWGQERAGQRGRDLGHLTPARDVGRAASPGGHPRLLPFLKGLLPACSHLSSNLPLFLRSQVYWL